MHRRCLIQASLLWLASWTPLAATAATPGNAGGAATEPGRELAAGIARLAQYDEEVDVQMVSEALKLPELLPSHDKPSALTWQGPSSRNESPQFFAYYDPPQAALGITKVVIFWNPMKGGGFSTMLRVVLRPGTCPSETLLAKALGATADTMTMPGYDGGPAYRMTTLTVKQPHGSAVQVAYTGGNTCNLDVRRDRNDDE